MYTYQSYVAALNSVLVEGENAAAFANIIPSLIDYAEQRILRDLDLLSTTTVDSSKSFAIGARFLALPVTPRFVVVEQVNVITPAATQPSAGTRNPLRPVSREVLDVEWPSVAGSGLPKKFAMVTDQSIIVGPWPDAAYVVEFVGTVRPTPLSSANPTTFLSQYLPDLFFAAGMIFGMGFQRDFGAQSDDPKAAQSWESQYQLLLPSAKSEEMRKKFIDVAQ